jgi:voltage-gated potassium channel
VLRRHSPLLHGQPANEGDSIRARPRRLAHFAGWWRNSGLEARLELFVLAAAVLSLPIVVLEELRLDSTVLAVADWLLWSVFAVEYAWLLIASGDRRGYFRRRLPWLAVVILSFPAFPALLGLTRLVRLARLGRLIGVGWRGLDALQTVLGRRGLVHVAAWTGVVVMAGGALIAELEPRTVGGGFWAGVWWAIVTVTTVGYGDIAPSTVGGRLVAVVLMMSGIGLTATLAATVAAYFVGQDDRPKAEELSVRLDAIESKLDLLLGHAADDSSAGQERS